MDRLIAEASRALAAGDALGALKRVALRDDPPALALRGLALARLGDLERARALLRRAARGFDPGNPVARARCRLAGAEIALVLRDLDGLDHILAEAGTTLRRHDDPANAAYATHLQARLALLIGRLDDAERLIAAAEPEEFPPLARPGHWTLVAGLAMRRIRADTARAALEQAGEAARHLAVPALEAEVAAARRAFDAPAARLITAGCVRPLGLAEVERLLASDRLVIDACRNRLRQGDRCLTLAGRPVLFGLLRTVAEAWPLDVARDVLLRHVFGARHSDESHRARLRVEIGRLRKEVRDFAAISATAGGFVLEPLQGDPAVLAPPADEDHAALLALLADGAAWNSSGLALALNVSPRTVQRALETLNRTGKVEWFGQGRARRWVLSAVPGFPTNLLLPAFSPAG